MNIQPLSNTYGKIKTVLFTHSGVKWNENDIKTYQNIMNAFGSEVIYIIFSIVDIPTELLSSNVTDGQKDLEASLVPPPSIEDYFESRRKELESSFKAAFQFPDDEINAASNNPYRTVLLVRSRVDYGSIMRPNGGRGQRFYNTSKWAQDPFCVLQGDQYSVLLEPIDPTTVMDSGKPFSDTYVADHLAASKEVKEALNRVLLLRSSHYHFQGGNVLSGTHWKENKGSSQSENFVLVGNRDLNKSIQSELTRQLDISGRGMNNIPVGGMNELTSQIKTKIFNYFQDTFSVPGISFTPENTGKGRKKSQPFDHLDQYLTLAGKHPNTGKEVVMVADLAAGVEIFMNNIAGSKTTVVEQSGPTGKRRLPSFIISDKELISRLNDTANEFSNKTDDNGDPLFEVIRLPMLLVDYAGVLYILSYNNCFIEIYRTGEEEETKTAYLPEYTSTREWFFLQLQASAKYKGGLLAVRQAVKQAFLDLKYPPENIYFIEGEYTKKASQRGALHCVAKVLERSNYVYDPKNVFEVAT